MQDGVGVGVGVEDDGASVEDSGVEEETGSEVGVSEVGSIVTVTVEGSAVVVTGVSEVGVGEVLARSCPIPSKKSHMSEHPGKI